MDYNAKIGELQKEFRTLTEENARKFQESGEKKEALTDTDYELIAKNNQRLDTIERELSMLKVQAERQARMGEFRDPLIDAAKSQDDDPLPNQKRKKPQLAEFYKHVCRSADSADSRKWLAENRAATGIGEDSDPIGGYAVPDAEKGAMLQTIISSSPIASRCRQVPITIGNTAKWPAVNETSRVAGSRLGGISTYWAGEGSTLTASKPDFRLVTLNLKKLTALVYLTDEIMQDAPQMEAFINEALQREFSTVIDDAIINGSGVGQPLGILNSAATVSILKESSGNGTGTLVFANLTKMLDRQIAQTGAVWLRSVTTGSRILSMTVGDFPVMIANQSATNGAAIQNLLGLPSFVVEACKAVGTYGDIICANLGYYLLGQKGGVQTASSIHVQFLTDQMALRFIARLDGQPWVESAITPMYGSDTLSPFTATETRS